MYWVPGYLDGGARAVEMEEPTIAEQLDEAQRAVREAQMNLNEALRMLKQAEAREEDLKQKFLGVYHPIPPKKPSRR